MLLTVLVVKTLVRSDDDGDKSPELVRQAGVLPVAGAAEAARHLNHRSSNVDAKGG